MYTLNLGTPSCPGPRDPGDSATVLTTPWLPPFVGDWTKACHLSAASLSLRLGLLFLPWAGAK